jgi:hypothetical protein
MTGCSAAIEAARRYREAEAACPPLAYGLHKGGGRCRRAGGPRVCGECAKDLLPRDRPSGGAEAIVEVLTGFPGKTTSGPRYEPPASAVSDFRNRETR